MTLVANTGSNVDWPVSRCPTGVFWREKVEKFQYCQGLFGCDVGNVGSSAVDLINLPRIAIDADGRQTGSSELDGERQSHVAQAEHAASGRPSCSPQLEEIVCSGRHLRPGARTLAG